MKAETCCHRYSGWTAPLLDCCSLAGLASCAAATNAGLVATGAGIARQCQRVDDLSERVGWHSSVGCLCCTNSHCSRIHRFHGYLHVPHRLWARWHRCACCHHCPRRGQLIRRLYGRDLHACPHGRRHVQQCAQPRSPYEWDWQSSVDLPQ